MIRYIIYGAGDTAKDAFSFLGECRVAYFMTTKYHNDDFFLGKRIIALEEIYNINTDDYIIVIASRLYWKEMEDNLRERKISRYFIFNDIDVQVIKDFYPGYVIWGHNELKTYTQILSAFGIRKYKKVAVYGSNYGLPYLLSEIEIQCGYPSVKYIVTDDCGVSTNDLSRAMGVQIDSIESIWNSIDCLIINCRRDQTSVFEVIENRDHSFDVLDIYDFDSYIPEYKHPSLSKYKDIHKGERCFIIGNGPSLSLVDLKKIEEHKEITFAFNMIYKIFDRIKWRPTYYGISDGYIYQDCFDMLDQIKCKAMFLADEYHRDTCKIKEGAEYFHYNTREYVPCHPKFSDDITDEVCWGRSVVYDIGLQFAMYMGFSQIYLLGCDNNYSKNVTESTNHFIKDYFDKDKTEKYSTFEYESRKVELAFEAARKYAEAHGVKIWNATRGGELEVFDRIDLDYVLEEIKCSSIQV